MNNKHKIILFLIAFFFTSTVHAQTMDYRLKDIFYPEFIGPVKSFTEYIINGTDTLRVLSISYSKEGYRESEYVRSTHSELGFHNETRCYSRKGENIISTNCMNDSITDTKISFDMNGRVKDFRITYSNQELSYFPHFDGKNNIDNIYTGLTKDKSFQYVGTLFYTRNESGLIVKSSADGIVPFRLTGVTTYTYDRNNLLIETTRVRSDSLSFTIKYMKHDHQGNWLKCEYQNGIRIIRKIEYYK